MATIDEASIMEELVRLRKGRGVLSPDLPNRCGPALTQIFGIGPGDGYSITHRKAVQALTSLAEVLSQDLQTALAAALAFHVNTNHRTLRERQDWLASQWQCDIRTVRRRTDDAIRITAAVAYDRYIRPQSHAATEKRPLCRTRLVPRTL